MIGSEELADDEKAKVEFYEKYIIMCELSAHRLYDCLKHCQEMKPLDPGLLRQARETFRQLIFARDEIYKDLERFWESMDETKVPYVPMEPPPCSRLEWPGIFVFDLVPMIN